MKKGVLYIASGSTYIEDAIESARSVKENTGLPVTLVADREVKNPHFDTVLQSNDFLYHYGDSVLQIPTLPYENTLLLDTDTIVSDDIDELFSLTDKWDIAASTVAESKFEIDEKVPSVLPEFNTGVILFNKNDNTSNFIDIWKNIYKEYLDRDIRMNQPAFREAVFQSPARVITIPTEYNCRANFGGYLTEKVKILHGSFDDTERTLNKLNESAVPRVFFNKNGELNVKVVNTTNNRFDWSTQ
jgi:hypothetical protein